MSNNSKGGAPKPSFFERARALIKRIDEKEVQKKSYLGVRGRQLIVLAALLGVSVFVGLNLLKLTVLQGDMWREKASDQQSRQETIKANRGTIYDANGTVLAQSSTVWNVIFAPVGTHEAEERLKKEYDENAANGESQEPYVPISEKIIKGLPPLLGVSEEDLREAYNSYADGNNFYTVQTKVEKPTVTIVKDFLNKNGILEDSVYFQQSSKRYYPNGELASNVIGFTNYQNNGVYGLEAYYDDYLSGTDGRAFYVNDTNGAANAKDKYFDAKDGYSLVLTLDEVMQHYLEKNLDQCVSQHSVINRACGIIMNCKTGGVIAMATTPSFDLNNPSEIFSDYDKQLLAQMKTDGKSEEEIAKEERTLREAQWKNKAVTELYYPGSVFKTVTAAAALDEEVISMDTTFNCPGVFNVSGTNIKCWNWYNGGHGTINLQQGLTVSCNSYFIQVGLALGVDKFYNYFEAFGFTEPTGIDLPGEADSYVMPRSSMGPVELASSAFGQTNKITPIQMCTAVCAIVNGGHLVTPYLVDKVLDSDGNVIETHEPQIKRQVISEETSAKMRQMMETIVTENGGHNAYIAGYRIGGKSGTAEKIDEHNKALLTDPNAPMTYIGTFAAAVPMDDPQLVMLVLVDTPTGPEYYGSAVACPVVSAVFKEGLEHMGIYPTYTAEEQAKMDAVVPQVCGFLSMKADSYIAAENFKTRFVGETTGEATVTATIPPGGSTIPKGSTVVVYMGDAEVEYGTVPDVIGKSAAEANELITNAGFNIKLSGGAAANTDAKATQQSYKAGNKLAKGSVIEVTFQASSFGD